MSRTLKAVLKIGVIALLPLVTSAVRVGPPQVGGGEEWLSWSEAERNTYIHGFIEGYWKGSATACKAADDLFEVGEPHRGDNQPSARCEARLGEYSRIRLTDSGVDFTAYTTVITDFYTRHSRYYGIPTVDLLSALGDSKCSTADQLYQLALKGDLRTKLASVGPP
jgi:hypothetical protein